MEWNAMEPDRRRRGVGFEEMMFPCGGWVLLFRWALRFGIESLCMRTQSAVCSERVSEQGGTM